MRRLLGPLAVLVLLGAHPGCGAPQRANAPTQLRMLDVTVPGFSTENRARIDRMLRELGAGSPSYDSKHPPVAVFDWDNTMMRNDIGDATFFWMLRHDRILQPPGRDWAITNRKLTKEAREALNGACDALAEPGKPLATSTHEACADALLAIYDRGQTPAGAPAWIDESTLMMHQPYAWGAQLQAGYTLEEVSGFAKQAYDENAKATISATQKVGSHEVTAYVRIYEPMKDLVAALRHDGFDVWVISASSQPLVNVVASQVGLSLDHVVGVRTLTDSSGKLGYRLAGCGTEADGADTVITFDRGKRCWINKAVFRLPAATQLEKAEVHQRPAFAAGDSDTDLAMVQDATHLKLVINRNKVGLMCNAYASTDGRWLVQPMFVEPLPARAKPYPCSTARDALGAPLVDEAGKAMPDVAERVFASP